MAKPSKYDIRHGIWFSKKVNLILGVVRVGQLFFNDTYINIKSLLQFFLLDALVFRKK